MPAPCHAPYECYCARCEEAAFERRREEDYREQRLENEREERMAQARAEQRRHEDEMERAYWESAGGQW